MTETVIILGAKGRFGRAATQAFVAAGWHTKALARSWENVERPENAKCITADAADPTALVREVRGSDVIVNAVNPPYHKWVAEVPKLTASVIRAASMTGATVIIPGNIYNYGASMPETLTEETPHASTGQLGRLRTDMEQSYSAAADSENVRTIILRAGDYLEGAKTGNWFDSYIANKVGKGTITYPGPLNLVHAWAYLPDVARAMVMLAEKRAAFPAFSEFGYEGYNLTGAELVDAVEIAAGRTLKVGKIPWGMIRLMAHMMPTLRGVVEMSYQWRTPHQINGSKLRASLPNFNPTPLKDALQEMLPKLSD